MSTLRKIKYQLVPLTITAASQSVSTSAVTTDRNYKRVKGIALNVSDAAAAEEGTFDKFEINSREIYPAGFETKLISCGQDVPPNDRYDKEVDEAAENSTVNITYTDGNAVGTAFPYTINVYLLLENPVEGK